MDLNMKFDARMFKQTNREAPVLSFERQVEVFCVLAKKGKSALVEAKAAFPRRCPE